MSARAIFKGVLRLADEKVPVKLYSAVTDRSVRFRLLHRRDKAPVQQVLINPESGETVDYQDAQRAWASEDGDLVLLRKEELDALKPDKNRDLNVQCFLPAGALDHRRYDRPYYLGPDEGADAAWRALAAALARSGREGLVSWVMRDKHYLGALRLHKNVPMLVTLRYSEEIISQAALTPPSGRTLDARELKMATQLMDMLYAPFDPTHYQDDYRENVLAMLRRKASGGRARKAVPARRRRNDTDLAHALQASLEGARRHGQAN